MRKAETTSIETAMEKLSHELRTPLGVAMGVVSDLIEGYEISAAELKDAGEALKRIREILDSIRSDSRLL